MKDGITGTKQPLLKLSHLTVRFSAKRHEQSVLGMVLNPRRDTRERPSEAAVEANGPSQTLLNEAMVCRRGSTENWIGAICWKEEPQSIGETRTPLQKERLLTGLRR